MSSATDPHSPPLRLDILRRELHRRGWSQADLARHAHLTPGTVSSIMRGSRPGQPTFLKIARALAEHPADEVADLLLGVGEPS